MRLVPATKLDELAALSLLTVLAVLKSCSWPDCSVGRLRGMFACPLWGDRDVFAAVIVPLPLSIDSLNELIGLKEDEDDEGSKVGIIFLLLVMNGCSRT